MSKKKIIGIIAGVFVVLVLAAVVSLYFFPCMEWGTFWSAVGAIATISASLAIFFAYWQLRYDAWLKAEEFLESFIEARAKVFSRLPDSTSPWTDKDEEDARSVCRGMNKFSRLLDISGMSESQILEHWDDPLAKAWAILEPIVKKEQNRTRWKKKWEPFERWGKLALKKLQSEDRDPRKRVEIDKANAA